MKYLNALLICVYLFVVGMGAAPVKAEWFFNGESTLVHDSNLGNAELDEDKVSDNSVALKFASGSFMPMEDGWSINLQGVMNGEIYDHYHGMNNLALGAEVELRKKMGLGAYAPWVSLSLSGLRLSYNEKVRDGWRQVGELTLGKRFSESWDVWMALNYEKRIGDHDNPVDVGVSGAAFDLSGTTIKFDAVHTLTDKVAMTMAYAYRYGDVVSSSLRDSPAHKYDGVSTAVMMDPVFGSESEAYRLTGSTQTFNVGVTYDLASHWLLGTEFQRVVTHGKGGNNYYVSRPSLSLSFSF